MSDSRIRVVARIRPKSKKEEFDMVHVLRANETTMRVDGMDESSTQFCFDGVYDAEDDQEALYDGECIELVDHCLNGGTATVLAYGQTGSGKTFTVLGKSSPDGNLHRDSGLFLRVFSDLFRASNANSVITLSAIELYVDDVLDLLGNRAKLKLRDTAQEVSIPGMIEVQVRSLPDVLAVFEVANQCRSVSATLMNDQSSRSHAIFIISVTHNGQVGKLMLVDLAGSERVKKSGVAGQGLAEAAAINTSLSALGTVVHALFAGATHVPFRDSKLTAVLKASLSNRQCRVLLVGQYSPAGCNVVESVSTAKFCDRVKGMNAPAPMFVDPAEEQRYLAAGKLNAELGTEARIIRESVGIAQTRTAGLVALQPDLKRRLAQGGEAAAAELRQTIAEEASAVESKFAQEFIAAHALKVQAEIAAMRERRAALEAQLAEAQSASQTLQSALAAATAQYEAEAADKVAAAKKVRKRRQQLEEARAAAAARGQELDDKITAATHALANPPGKRRRSLADGFDEEEDPEEQRAAAEAAAEAKWEATHRIIESFYTNWAALRPLHDSSLDAIRQGRELQDDILRASKVSPASILGEQLAADVVAFAVDRAADIAEGAIDPAQAPIAWVDVSGASQRLVSSAYWHPRPLPVWDAPPYRHEGIEAPNRTWLSDEDNDVPMPQRGGTPVDTAMAGGSASVPAHAAGSTSAMLGAAASRSAGPAPSVSNTVPAATVAVPVAAVVPAIPPPSAAPAAAGTAAADGQSELTQAAAEVAQVRRKKTKAEAAEAEKHYLMKVYDSPSLVDDLIKYLGVGCQLTKHGRYGKPHKRHVSLSAATGAGSISGREIFWADPESGDRKSMPVGDISSVVLGPYSKVFQRQTNAPTSKDYYLSFTIHFKDGGRTLDFVAETTVDFEAWVLGLCHLARVDPVWGRPLTQLAQLDAADYESLTPLERTICERENIWPASYVKIMRKVVAIRDEVAMHMRVFSNDASQAYQSIGGIHIPQVDARGAILMTKGELRYHCNEFGLDVFRVGRVWEHLASLGLIFDPKYSPPTNFGLTMRMGL